MLVENTITLPLASLVAMASGVLGGILVWWLVWTGRLKAGNHAPQHLSNAGEAPLRAAASLTRNGQQRQALREWLLGEWSYDVDAGLISGDRTIFRMFGEPAVAGPVAVSWFLERIHPDDRGLVVEKWSLMLGTKTSLDIEYRVVWPDGSLHWIGARTGMDVQDPQRRVFGLSTDITARKNAEAALKASENRFRELANFVPEVVWTATKDAQVDFVNDRWRELTGFVGDPTSAQAWVDLMHPDDVEASVSEWGRASQRSTPLQMEYRLWDRHHGAYRWHLARGLPQFDENGNVSRWFGTATDIDDVKRAQAEVEALNASLEERVRRRTSQLFESEQLMKLMVEGVKDYAILMLDPELRITTWNSGAERLYGYAAGEAIGQNISMFYTDEDIRAGLPQRCGALALEQGRFHEEGLRVHKDGSLRWASRVLTPFRDEAGQVRGFSSIVRDTTEQKEAMEDLREAQQSADKANKAKSAFLAAMSHEIRTPMNAILGMADVLSNTRLDEQQREYVDAFRSAGRGLLSLIDGILDLSKIEAGRMTLEQSSFALRPLVTGAVDLFRPHFAEKGIRLLLELNPQADITVVGDPARLRQVLVNLISNSAKFTHYGEVTVTVGRGTASVAPVTIEFSVSDTGIGIPASQLGAIFEDFTQADSSTSRKYGGTGLGLSICRRIVEAMGGKIEVESIPGGGTTFTVSIPFHQPAVSAPAEPAKQTVDSTLRGPPREGLRILIAEDNDQNQRLLKAYLGKTGYVLTLVEDGQSAVERVQQEDFDMVLMDVRMPKMDGLTATRAIRERERNLGSAPVPILALTADAGPEETERSLSAGCNAHLTKPISKGTLLAAIGKFAPQRPLENGRRATGFHAETERTAH